MYIIDKILTDRQTLFTEKEIRTDIQNAWNRQNLGHHKKYRQKYIRHRQNFKSRKERYDMKHRDKSRRDENYRQNAGIIRNINIITDSIDTNFN